MIWWIKALYTRALLSMLTKHWKRKVEIYLAIQKNFFSLLGKSKVIKAKVINRFGFFFSLSKRWKTINGNEQVSFTTAERMSKKRVLMFLGDMKMGSEKREKSVFIIFVTYGSKTSFPCGKRIARESRIFFL